MIGLEVVRKRIIDNIPWRPIGRVERPESPVKHNVTNGLSAVSYFPMRPNCIDPIDRTLSPATEVFDNPFNRLSTEPSFPYGHHEAAHCDSLDPRRFRPWYDTCNDTVFPKLLILGSIHC
jgi:hypothetical protein